MQYCLPLSFNPRIPRGMRQRGRWTFAVSLAFNPRVLRGMRQVVFVVHNRIPCTFNPRILRGMRHQFCTNNNSIYWYNLLNINNNLSTGYYYLAHLILAKTIHTLFSSANPPVKLCTLHIRTLATIHASHEGCDKIKGEKVCEKTCFNPRIRVGCDPSRAIIPFWVLL